MIAPRLRGALFFSLAVVATACGNSGTEPSGGNTSGNEPTNPLTSVRIASGNGQVGLPGSALAPISIYVLKNQTGVAGASVTFAVTQGSATLSPTTATTDADGVASTKVTLGTATGPVVVTATVANTGLAAVFNLGDGNTTGTVTPACQIPGATASAPAVGGATTGLTGTGICLGGGTSGAEYALVGFYANPDSSQVATLSVHSTGGATPVFSASEAPAFNVTPSMSGARIGTRNLQASFSAHMRDMARRELTSKIPAARRVAQQHASFATIPANPSIGTLVTLNAQGEDACDNPITVTARVVAVSNQAIVVADTANPAGGFTNTEYAVFATTFDTLVSPLDVQNFGSPSDIDKNGKVIIFFTKEVNKLTPRGSEGVVGGFFFERDLFPTTSTAELQGCAGSNYAEMYYSLVPDPHGVYSDARSDSSVKTLTPGTLVHEFQHLINASRRIYVNNADSFEDTWLNEGLSHVAEELLYYRVAGLAPRQNITASVLGRSQAAVDAFNNYQGDNVGRYESFLDMPNGTSVYAGNDSLETRGATWNLLRYLADHRGTSDADTWSKLDNTALTGQQNIANVFGTNYMTQIRDWATSVFADDLTGQTDTRFSQPSWNFRNIFPQLVNNDNESLGSYPLLVFPLSDHGAVSTTVDAGGAAYIRFAVPANASVSVDWGVVTPLMQFTIVRTK
ncbi:MAG TPA: hypothetical protein VGM67_17255 [Gemmatimonadaceae bacterium]|jgi:hypothetical protein